MGALQCQLRRWDWADPNVSNRTAKLPGPQQGLATGEMGLGVSLHRSDMGPFMSALGQKQTSAYVRVMSALPPKADMDQPQREIIRLLYVVTRQQVKALTACLELEGLE